MHIAILLNLLAMMELSWGSGLVHVRGSYQDTLPNHNFEISKIFLFIFHIANVSHKKPERNALLTESELHSQCYHVLSSFSKSISGQHHHGIIDRQYGRF